MCKENTCLVVKEGVHQIQVNDFVNFISCVNDNSVLWNRINDRNLRYDNKY